MKKHLAIVAVSAMLLASGCTARDLPLVSTVAIGEDIPTDSSNAINEANAASTELGTISYAETEIAWEEGPAEPLELTSPPIMRIEAVGEVIASCMNMTQCGYTWSITQGAETSEVIACGASPYQSYELGHVTAVINTLDLAKAPTVLLTNGGEIEYVYCWGSDDGYQEVQFTEEGDITLPEEPVGAVYEVSIVFPQGRCSYLFATEEREPVDYSTNAQGATSPAYDPTAQTSAAYVPAELCGYPLA